MKISVILPIYNTEKYLADCLDSILAQSFEDFEIVAVNDGSPDGSANILEKYKSEYPEKIKVINKENGGLSSARNSGIKASEGEYLAFIDSDDTVSPDFLLEMFSYAEKNSLDIVLCDFYYRYEGKADIYAPISKGLSEDPVRDYLLSAPMACTRLIKRELLENEGFTENILYEDLERMPRLILQTEKAGRIKKPLYYYYQRSGSIMNRPRFSAKLLDIFTVLDNIYLAFERSNMLSEYHFEIEYLYIEHLLRSAAMRFIDFDNREELFDRIISVMNEKFPDHADNPYLKKSGLKFRTAVYLSSHKKYLALSVLKKIRG